MAALRFLSLRRSLLAGLLDLPASSMALSTADITASTASPDCLSYRVVGICYWLFCTPFGCKVRTSTKVRHYVPDGVVSSYANTGDNPWRDVRPLSPANPTAQSGAPPVSSNSSRPRRVCSAPPYPAMAFNRPGSSGTRRKGLCVTGG